MQLRACFGLGLSLMALAVGCSGEPQHAPELDSREQQPAATSPTGTPANASTPTTSTKLGSLRIDIPNEWQAVPTDGQMRKAEWKLPGDAGAASLIAYHFGAGGAGMVQANLDRWKGQFAQEPADNARIEEGGAAGSRWTLLDVRGRYVAETRPGSGERQDLPNQRMLAAVIDAAEGPFYLKAVGPQATIDRWEAALSAVIKNPARD